MNNGSFNIQDQIDNDFASVLQTIQAKKAAQKQRISLWAEQRSNANGNSLAQTQDSDSSSNLNQDGSNEENDQDQAIDIVEDKIKQLMETKLFKINYLTMKMLKAKIQMVQAIAKYKISIVKSIKLKQVSVLV